MITFGIPLKGRKASKDWNVTCSLFRRTLLSVTLQRKNGWRVLVACDEIPPVPAAYLSDDRIEFIVMPARQALSPMDDKGRKVNAIAYRHRQNGGGFLMLVDADDLVSNRIAELCEVENVNGFCSNAGYLYFEKSRFLRIVKNPWKICGSCTIVNWKVEDLPPRLVDGAEDLNKFRKQFAVNASHGSIPDLMDSYGRPLSPSPFVISIYSCGNGENNSIRSAKSVIKAAGKNVLRCLHPIKPLSARIVEEFSLYPLDAID